MPRPGSRQGQNSLDKGGEVSRRMAVCSGVSATGLISGCPKVMVDKTEGLIRLGNNIMENTIFLRR